MIVIILFNQDYLFVIGAQFLISIKVEKIFTEMNIINIEYFESHLIQPNGNCITGYKTAIIKSEIPCADMEKSEYLISEVNNDKIYFFSKVVLDKKKYQAICLFLD